MSELIILATTGLPDRTQGGSGIFNYLLLDHLLSNGYEVLAFFRLDGPMRAMPKDYDLLVERGIRPVVVPTKTAPTRLDFGLSYLLKAHKVQDCRQAVETHIEAFRHARGCISLDLGWAVALADKRIPALGILGDPLPARLPYTQPPNSNVWWKRYLLGWHQKILQFSLRSVFHSAAPLLKKPVRVAMFSPQHSQEMHDAGIDCTHLHFAIPDPYPNGAVRKPPRRSGEELVLLHVGTLQTTASFNMVQSFQSTVIPALEAVDFPIRLRFVGQLGDKTQFTTHAKNLTIDYVGRVETLDEEFARADLFFAPMNYPVGARTRVMTAMAYGIPILTDRSVSVGIPELVDGRDIYYADTTQELIHQLSWIAENPAAAAKLGLAGRHYWSTLFNPSINLDLWLNLAISLSAHSQEDL